MSHHFLTELTYYSPVCLEMVYNPVCFSQIEMQMTNSNNSKTKNPNKNKPKNKKIPMNK